MPAIYQADTWCDSCADAIRADILAAGKAPEDPEDETSYDSDEYPKYMSEDVEQDCPMHCAAHADCLQAEVLPSGHKIGALLSTSLTSHGVEYVREAIQDGGEVAEFWEREFTAAGYDFTCPHCGR